VQNTPEPGDLEETPTLEPTPTETPTETPTDTPLPEDFENPEGESMLLDWEGGEIIYTYDGDGNLVKSVIDNKTTYYPNQYYEKRMVDAQQTIFKYYFVGLARIALRENGTITWLLSDHLGSTSGTVNAAGALVSTMKYTAFGETRGTGSSTTDYRYTGQREEEEIGLYFFKARFYDAALGRFVQPDTILPDPANAKSFDRFAYVENNPISNADSSGHCIDGITTIPCLVAIIAIAGVSGGAAVYQFNVSGNSWWESPEDALATAKAGIEGGLLAVGTALTAGQAALMVPDVAMYFGVQTNNLSVFSWGATQNGYLPSVIPSSPNSNTFRKVEFQGRTVYQRNDIDWDFVDPDSNLTNYQLAQRGLAPIGPDGQKVQLHHLLQKEPGPMAEILTTTHVDGQKILHGLIPKGSSFRNSPALNNQYNKFRMDYWKWRVE